MRDEGVIIAIERVDSIAGVDRSQWDRLAGDNVFASWGWLKTSEETRLSPRDVVYVVARGADGLLAAAPCAFQDSTTPVVRIDQVLFGRFAKPAAALGISALPALVCGTPTGLAEHVLIVRDRPAGERAALLVQMIEAMEQMAAREGRTLCFRNVGQGDHAELAEVLRARGYLRASEMPSTFLDVGWSSFPEYVRDLKRRHPRTAKNVNRERRRAFQAGLAFRELRDPVPLEDRLHALLDRHNRRLNRRPFAYRCGFLSTLKRYLGDRCVLFLAVQDEEPVSIVVGARNGEDIYLVMVGFDETRGRDGKLYFNNSYNEPIRYAIEKRLRRIYAGKLVYDVKARRGFDLLSLDMYLRVPRRLHAAALRPVLACQSALLRSRMARVAKTSSRALEP